MSQIDLQQAPLSSLTSKDRLARFYTKERVGDLLIQSLGSYQPTSLLDLGCGLGALSHAATRRWNNISIVTVDIDLDAQRQAWINARSTVTSHRHISGDALSEDIFDRVKSERIGGFDAVLSNPPFVKPKWRACYEKIIEGAGLSNVIAIKSAPSADVLFLAQALRLVRTGGLAGFIVPEGLIAGSKSEKIRNFLINNHQIQSVIALQPNSFDGIEVKTHLLTIRKGSPIEPYKIKIGAIQRDGTASSIIAIDPGIATKRLDYDYHSARKIIEHCSFTLGSIGADIVRGTMTSTDCRSFSHFVLHTSNFYAAEAAPINVGDRIIRTLALCNSAENIQNGKNVCAGDIVVSRVGRNLHQKIALITGGSAPISDCIFRIRVPEKLRIPVALALSSPRGQQWLNAVSHGAGAAHITKSELLEFPVPNSLEGQFNG
jgi:type I restriction enzyme M protein